MESSNASPLDLSLADPLQLVAALTVSLDDIPHAKDESDAFAQLDRIGQQISAVTKRISRYYQHKPFPLGDIEVAFFQQGVFLLLKAAKTYASCLGWHSLSERDSLGSPALAICLQRCLHYTGAAIFEHFQARREVPPRLWKDLHGYYARAENAGVETLIIADPYGGSTHCTATYIGTLLCDMGLPFNLSVNEQALVRNWANQWSRLVTLHKLMPGDPSPPLLIDLMGSLPRRLVGDCERDPSLRRMDTTLLTRQVKDVQSRLRQGVTPLALNLGDTCTRSQCLRVLGGLAGPWSQTLSPRKFRRKSTSGPVKLYTGFEDIYYVLSGKVFVQPETTSIYRQMHMAGLAGSPKKERVDHPGLQQDKEGVPCNSDTWELIDQSANGFRIVCRAAGRRLEVGQLVALCPPDADRFLLAKVSWLVQGHAGEVTAGIVALPGIGAAVGARIVERDGISEIPFRPAFLIRPISPGQVGQSLVLLQEGYQVGNVIELSAVHSAGSIDRVRLELILEVGRDFQRFGVTM